MPFRYRVENRTRPLARPLWVRVCRQGLCRLLGLMFRRSLREEEGLLFVWPRSGRWSTAIHMAFMFFPLALIWLDERGVVVDRRLGRPWRTIAVPRQPARYVLELHASRLEDFQMGDWVRFLDDEDPWQERGA